MTILVFGGNGQLGQELLRTLVPEERVVATTRSGLLPDGTPCERADFEHPETLVAVLERLRPSWVLNAAAYTSVDRAEDEPDVARRINEIAPGVIARWCALADVPMVHYSTDYVFDGNACRPYREDDATAPLGVHGPASLPAKMPFVLQVAAIWFSEQHGCTHLTARIFCRRCCGSALTATFCG